ncbi:MAG TPA: hypothetical protein VGL02_18450 [Streptomyces sp.]
MGWLTPKYPKSDTPGATAITPVAAPRSSRSSRRTSGSGSTPAPSGMTIDQLRGLAMHAGGKVEKRGKYMLVSVEKKGLFGGTDYSHQRYVQQNDGTWKAG